MDKLKIFSHGSYIGTTGYNQHTRDFFRHLSKHCDIKVRNFTIGSSWSVLSEEPHNLEPYINDVDKKLLKNNRFIKSDPRVPSPLNSTQRSAKVRNLNFNNTAPPSAFNTLSRHIYFGPRQRSMLPPERKTLT
jgi:hypothetical protein